MQFQHLYKLFTAACSMDTGMPALHITSDRTHLSATTCMWDAAGSRTRPQQHLHSEVTLLAHVTKQSPSGGPVDAKLIKCPVCACLYSLISGGRQPCHLDWQVLAAGAMQAEQQQLLQLMLDALLGGRRQDNSSQMQQMLVQHVQ